MRVKFGSIVTSGSGSVGGHTIQNSRGGAQMRTKPINKKAPSVAQQLIRSYNPQLQQGWRNLTNVQRWAWAEYAVTHGVFNKNGDKHPLSGHSLWMKYNFVYISNQLPFILSPYNFETDPFGSELVVNGSFDGQAPWTETGEWSFVAGFANYLDGGTKSINQDAVVTTGLSYRYSFDISNAAPMASTFMFSEVGGSLFAAPYDGLLMLGNGIHSFDVTAIATTPVIRIFGATAGSVFSITNISLRQIL